MRTADRIHAYLFHPTAMMTDEELARVAVSRLALASAPERIGELQSLWDTLSPQFSLVDDRTGTTLDAAAFGIVRFTHRTMLQFWLLSFATWKATAAWLVIVNLSKMASGRIIISPGDGQGIPDQQVAEQVYADALRDVRLLSEATSVESFSWPPDVPKPDASAKFSNTTEQAAFELCVVATGFAFLHECHHLHLAQGGALMEPPIEELECDAFARDFLLKGIAEYSSASGEPEHLVREKRALGCALNGFFVLALTPKDLWKGSATHPPVSERFRRSFEAVGSVSPDGQFFSIVASLLVSHLHFVDSLPPRVEAPDERTLCLMLLDYM
jgi:hypothetical protein